jgi:hypothetical protein
MNNNNNNNNRQFDDESTVVTSFFLCQTQTSPLKAAAAAAKQPAAEEEEKEGENLMKIIIMDNDKSSSLDTLPKGDKADPAAKAKAKAKKPNKEEEEEQEQQQRKADLLPEGDLSSYPLASTTTTSTTPLKSGESKESLQGLKSIILTEHKNVASFVVIGETLDRLYYKDKLVKNQKEFLEWTKINLGFSKSTTYEYIISYRVGTRFLILGLF